MNALRSHCINSFGSSLHLAGAALVGTSIRKAEGTPALTCTNCRVHITGPAAVSTAQRKRAYKEPHQEHVCSLIRRASSHHTLKQLSLTVTGQEVACSPSQAQGACSAHTVAQQPPQLERASCPPPHLWGCRTASLQATHKHQARALHMWPNSDCMRPAAASWMQHNAMAIGYTLHIHWRKGS